MDSGRYIILLAAMFYLLLLAFCRGRLIARRRRLLQGPPDTVMTILVCLDMCLHVIAMVLWSIPGVFLVLVYVQPRLHQLAGLLVMVTFAAILSTKLWRRAYRGRREPSADARKIAVVLTVVFWMYFVQLSAAWVLRIVPAEVTRDSPGDPGTPVWKGRSMAAHVVPLVGFWAMMDPDAYYMEFAGDGPGDSRPVEVLPPDPNQSRPK